MQWTEPAVCFSWFQSRRGAGAATDRPHVMPAQRLTKEQFYAAAGPIALVEWWLHECDLPALTWARMRVFANESADVCWEEGGKVYGFDRPEFAGFFLSEDEYRRLSTWDAEDEKEFGVRLADLIPPTWSDAAAGFEYLGTY
jgi:hypothetical protein